MSAWSKEPTYDEQIAPLMSQIIDICKRHEVPLVCSFQYGYTEEDGALLCTTILTKFAQTDAHMLALATAHQRTHGTVLAETVETLPDGTKRVTIRRA